MTGTSSKYRCPTCGHRRTAAHCWNCSVPQATRFDPVELAAAVVVVSALQPFVSAIATKAGEDVWPKIAKLVGRRRRKEIEARIDHTETLEIVANGGRLVVEMPTRLPASAAASLRDVVATLERTEGRFRVSYDAATSTWSIVASDNGVPPQSN
ncbi:hypothetical protein SAMN06297387_108106 [Streptomyces zhaozhouensis]|uniref:Uncharacterized protein n=1 Tax=Streptomyces zhaozhouensis TaxID=1300267 RepID=A0A286DWE0_9ACTN|nr:hypothetical protein [Streptomyces zhaozhouensis]SOD62943.1 hypothetical protein SAMN06297387_108106 [Streptomyces zhaozhouensis]